MGRRVRRQQLPCTGPARAGDSATHDLRHSKVVLALERSLFYVYVLRISITESQVAAEAVYCLYPPQWHNTTGGGQRTELLFQVAQPFVREADVRAVDAVVC